MKRQQIALLLADGTTQVELGYVLKGHWTIHRPEGTGEWTVSYRMMRAASFDTFQQAKDYIMGAPELHGMLKRNEQWNYVPHLDDESLARLSEYTRSFKATVAEVVISD